MNTRSITSLLTIMILHPGSAMAQGSLTPPGPPAPVMKTLDQIEPRTPVNAVTCPGDAGSQFIITQPGSYYLTGNLTGVAGKSGIQITASNVTLDLGGFTLTGDANSLNGIRSTSDRVRIHHGNLIGWPHYAVTSHTNSTIEDLHISGCAGKLTVPFDFCLQTSGFGIIRRCELTGNHGGIECSSCDIEDCHVRWTDCGFGIRTFGNVRRCRVEETHNGGYGIALSATTPGIAEDCVVADNSGGGILGGFQSRITNCICSGNGSDADGFGIFVNSRSIVEGCSAADTKGAGIVCFGDGSIVRHCTAGNNTVAGIDAANFCSITDCTVTANYGDGIRAAGKNLIRGCLCSSNGTGAAGAGIHTTASGNRIEGNETRDNKGHGIRADAGPSGDFIMSNTSYGSPVNYLPSTGSTFAPVQSVTAQTNPSANH